MRGLARNMQTEDSQSVRSLFAVELGLRELCLGLF